MNYAYVFLFLLLAACGKSSQTDTSSQVTTQNQNTSERLAIELDTAQEHSVTHLMERGAHTSLPERLNVKSGSVIGKKISLYYNIDPRYGNSSYDFRCVYKSGSNNALTLDKCYNFGGQDFGNVSGVQFTLDPQTLIRMEWSGNPSDAVVEAAYLVDWK